jgi:hypothetical protein
VGASLSEPEAQYRLLVKIIKEGILLTPGKSGVVTQHGDHGPVQTAKRTYSINYGEPLSSNKKYQASIVCFADIPLDDLPIHIKKYSGFGLSFLRPFLLLQGANPVFYIARQSVITIPKRNSLEAARTPLAEHFDAAEHLLSELIVRPQNNPFANDPGPLHPDAAEFLTHQLFPFFKFFDAELGDEHPDNFYMEREWRIVGPVHFRVRDIERLLVPRAFSQRVRADVPSFAGQLSLTD